MKKYIKLSATAALGLFLVACGTDTADDATEVTQESEETVEMVETVEFVEPTSESGLSLPAGTASQDEDEDDRQEDVATFKFYIDGEEDRTMELNVEIEDGMTVYEAMMKAQEEAQEGNGGLAMALSDESGDDLGVNTMEADESAEESGLEGSTTINDPDAFHFYMDDEGVVWSIYDIDNDWEMDYTWTYLVNDVFAEYGIQSQEIEAGDVIEWHYGDSEEVATAYDEELISEDEDYDVYDEEEQYEEEEVFFEEEYEEEVDGDFNE